MSERLDKDNMTVADWEVLFAALLDEARAGRLASIVMMLKAPEDPTGNTALIDYFGTVEHTEIACRKALQSIVFNVARTNASLASAIQAAIPLGIANKGARG